MLSKSKLRSRKSSMKSNNENEDEDEDEKSRMLKNESENNVQPLVMSNRPNVEFETTHRELPIDAITSLADLENIEREKNENSKEFQSLIGLQKQTRVLHTHNHECDNVQEVDEDDEDDEKEYNEFCSSHIVKPTSKYLRDSYFSQQRLPAWTPLLTPKFVFHLFLIFSIVFLPIGILLYFESYNIYEFKHEYTDCKDISQPNETCKNQLIKNINYKCKCRIDFFEERFQYQTLNVYYMLENYYQNHRRYVKSKDNDQLMGRNVTLVEDCDPYREKSLAKVLTGSAVESDLFDVRKYSYAPCGAVANSLFNDTFSIFYKHMLANKTVRLNISKKNLAWDSDRRFKYKNPSTFNQTLKPPYWPKNISEMENGYLNEDLMVWLRVSAFPTFKKLYGRILLEENSILVHPTSISNKTSTLQRYLLNFYDNSVFNKLITKSNLDKATMSNSSTSEPFDDDQASIIASLMSSYMNSISNTYKYRLPKGHYYVDIEYKYPVHEFRGKKYFILSNTSWIGDKCYFLAWAYILVGSLCFITSIALFFFHVYFGHMDYNGATMLKDQIKF